MTQVDPDSSQDVLRLFDAKAASWPAKYAAGGRLTGRLENLVREIESRTHRGDRVLDLGCGSGELARHLAAAGRVVTGCDISAQMIRRAEAADKAKSLQWIRLPPRWRELPFRDSAFDVIVASSVLEYVDEPAAVFRECARVLRPGGTVLCTVPDLRHPIRWLEWAAGAVMRIPQAQAAAEHLPKTAAYLAYLRISRQRHRRGWWRKEARYSGLALASPVGMSQPLQIIVFKRITGEPG